MNEKEKNELTKINTNRNVYLCDKVKLSKFTYQRSINIDFST